MSLFPFMPAIMYYLIYSFQQPYKSRTTIAPISKIREQTWRDCAQGHAAHKQQSQDCDLERVSGVLTSMLFCPQLSPPCPLGRHSGPQCPSLDTGFGTRAQIGTTVEAANFRQVGCECFTSIKLRFEL